MAEKDQFVAKPTGVSLVDHSRNVKREAEIYFEQRPFVNAKWERTFGKSLKTLVCNGAAPLHDIGKSHPYWQNPCRADYEDYLAKCLREYNSLSDPALSFEEYCVQQRRYYMGGRHIREASRNADTWIRHEIATLKQILYHEIPMEVAVSIACHHGRLGYRHRDRHWLNSKVSRLLDADEWWRRFSALDFHIREKAGDRLENALRAIHRYDAARAVLQYADRRASALEEGQKMPDLLPFNYHFRLSWTKRVVQKKAEDLADNFFCILRAPTGSGKTDAALLWIKKQIKLGRADRGIIAMPTRFTCNSLSVERMETLSRLGLYHSTSWLINKNMRNTEWVDEENVSPEEYQRRQQEYARQQMELAKFFETPLTVTTIDQLCIALAGHTEDLHRRRFNMTNACIVIDEVDFYDDFTRASILVLLTACRIWNIPVLMMSATVPDAAVEYYRRSGFAIDCITEDTTDAEVPRWTIRRAGPCSMPSSIQPLLEKAFSDIPLIIYANTVERAQQYYLWFNNQKIARKRPDLEVALYHSQFTEPDKVQKEKQIVDMLGYDAWNEGRAHGVVILTQIGESSINISAQMMITDLCPVDRIAQRVGRLGRFAEKLHLGESEAFVVVPYQGDDIYCAPYGYYSQNQNIWVPNEVWKATDAILEEGVYSSGDFVRMVNEVYQDMCEESPKVRQNREALESLIINNWLILPNLSPGENELDTPHWRCRDIPVQEVVYVVPDNEFIPTAFKNHYELYEFQHYYGISIHQSNFTKGRESGKLIKFDAKIGNEDYPVFVVAPGCYNPELGLRL